MLCPGLTGAVLKTWMSELSKVEVSDAILDRFRTRNLLLNVMVQLHYAVFHFIRIFADFNEGW